MPTIPALVKQAFSNWDDAAALRFAGCELHDRTRFDLAREVLDRALELDPGDWEAWAHRSYCEFRSLRGEEGRAILRRGIEASQSDRLRGVLANFIEDEEEKAALRAGLEKSEDPAVRADLCAQKVHAGDEEALAQLRELAAENPGDRAVRAHVMWTLMGARNRNLFEGLDLREEGVPLADLEIAGNPDSIRGHWMKLQMLFSEKDWGAVIEAADAALERHPDDETVMYLRGRALQEEGDLDRAAHWLSRAIGAKRSFGGARVALGKVYEAEERFELAEETFREITVANPDYPGGDMSLALHLVRRGRLDEAERVFLATWPELPEWMQFHVLQNPDAKPLLERDAVRSLLPERDDSPANPS